jgi:hypothetical protein
MIGPLDDDSSVPIQAVVDIHAAVSVVNIGTGPVGASTDHTAVCSMYFMTTRGRRMTGEGSRRSWTPRSTARTAGAGMGSAKTTARARATRTSSRRTMRSVRRRTVRAPATRSSRRRTVRASAARSSRRRPMGSATTWSTRSVWAPASRCARMPSGRRIVGRRRGCLLFFTGDTHRRVGDSQGEQQTRRSQGSVQRADL